jgi:hypothetical protein
MNNNQSTNTTANSPNFLSTFTTQGRKVWICFIGNQPMCREQSSRQQAIQSVSAMLLNRPDLRDYVWPVWDGDLGRFVE